MNCSLLLRISADSRPSTLREITLSAGQTWSAQLPQGARVNCARGVIWLTQSDDATDFVLRAGQSFVAPRSSHVVVQAMGETMAILRVETSK